MNHFRVISNCLLTLSSLALSNLAASPKARIPNSRTKVAPQTLDLNQVAETPGSKSSVFLKWE